MKFTIYQESRLGKRANNEDRLAYSYSRDALLMVVADGMGGHFYGEVAAQIAVQTLTEAFQRQATPSIADPFLFLQKASRIRRAPPASPASFRTTSPTGRTPATRAFTCCAKAASRPTPAITRASSCCWSKA